MNSEETTIDFICQNEQPIAVPFQKFITHSNLLTRQAWKGEIKKDINYNDKYAYDSILQFSRAVVNEEPKITKENVFGYLSLCDEWEVDDGVKKYAKDFEQENEQALLINHIFFQLSHKQDSSSEKENLRENLPKYIDDPNLTQLPFDVLNEVVDFKVVEDDQESFQKVYSFCLKYLDEHEDIENCSELFSTLNTSKISYEDLSRLTGNPNFDRTKLNDSLGIKLRELVSNTEEVPQKLAEIQEKYKQDLDDMKARKEEYEKDQEESQLLRQELNEEKEKVADLIKKVDDLRNARLDDITKFLKELNQLREDIIKDQKEREEKEKEMKRLEEEQQKKELKELKAAVPLYYPDWSTASNLGWSSTNASDDGWMCVQTGCSNYSSPSYVTVAGKKNLIVSGCNSGYAYSSVFFPIKQGQSLSYNTSSTTSSYAYFMKTKKSSVVTVPDWENATLMQWFQNYNAQCDGWIYADTGSNGNQGYVKINDSFNIYICQHNNGYYTYSSVLIPVSSGDKYYFYHGGYPGVCYFIPGRKDNQVGMVDWNKEKGQSWNTKYVAGKKGWVYAQCQSYYCTNTSTSNTPGYLMVNGIPILISKNNNSYYDNASVLVPVAKGDKYNAIGGYQNQSISFFPCLK